MKNLDIEKLERKNIYKVPDGFFEQMQSQILNKTQPKQNAKIIKLNWVYAAAAAITLFFGITFVINQNNQEEVMTQVSNGENKGATNSLSTNKMENKETVALRILEEDLPANQKENEKPITIAEKQPKRENKIIPQNTEIQVEQILANFTSAELADVGKNTEQDIYLDLYN